MSNSLKFRKPRDQLHDQRESLVRPWSPQDIQKMEPEELQLVCSHFGISDHWGTIRLPSKWASKTQSDGAGYVSLTNRFSGIAKSEAELNLAILTIIRLVVLCLFCPSQTSYKRGQAFLSPSSIFSNLACWIAVLKKALAMPPTVPGILIGRLKIADIRGSNLQCREMQRFWIFSSKGLWTDVITRESISHLEQSNRGIRNVSISAKELNPYLPLPDRLVQAAGTRSAWITRHLATSVITAVRECAHVFKGVTEWAGKTAAEKILQDFNWRNADGVSIDFLPFEIIGMAEESEIPRAWIPRTWQQLLKYLELTQDAHFFICGLSSGPRAGEILSFKVGNIIECSNGITVASGRTYKIVDNVEGQDRDWPMPAIAVQALIQQAEISKIVSEFSTVRSESSDLVAINLPVLLERLSVKGKDLKWLARISANGNAFRWSENESMVSPRKLIEAAKALDLLPEDLLFINPGKEIDATELIRTGAQWKNRTTPVFVDMGIVDDFLMILGKERKWLQQHISIPITEVAFIKIRIDVARKIGKLIEAPVQRIMLDVTAKHQEWTKREIKANGNFLDFESTKLKSKDTPLWRVIATGRGEGNRLSGTYNSNLRDYIAKLNLLSLNDEQSITFHRFRKTLARLVALAISHSPKILMDIFGHKSIEMTMHYVMANPEMAAEIETVQKSLAVIMAKKAVQNVGKNGGPAADTLRGTITEIKFRRSKEDFGAMTEDELAMQLTVSGRYWRYVRPMVICTKLDGEAGPCQQGRNAPNPARCRIQCKHRLVEPELIHQVDETIEHLIKKMQAAIASDDFIVLEFYEGQLLASLNEFEILKEKWADHDMVIRLLRKSISR